MHRFTLVLTRLHGRLETYCKSSVTKGCRQLNNLWEISLRMFLTQGQSVIEPAVEICKDLGVRYFTFASFFSCLIDCCAWASWLRRVVVFCLWCVPAGNLLPLQLSVSGLTMRMSLFVYHQVNLFRCLTLLSTAETGSWHSLSVYCARSAILPEALVGKRQGRYKPNKLLLSGGERKKNTERKKKETKEEKKGKERENNRRDLLCQSPGGEMLGFTCYNLLGNWRFCVKWFWCRGKCKVSVLSALKGEELIFIWGQRHIPSVHCHPPSPPSVLRQKHSVHRGGQGQVYFCNGTAITVVTLTVSHNGLLLKAQFNQITQENPLL